MPVVLESQAGVEGKSRNKSESLALVIREKLGVNVRDDYSIWGTSSNRYFGLIDSDKVIINYCANGRELDIDSAVERFFFAKECRREGIPYTEICDDSGIMALKSAQEVTSELVKRLEVRE